jgi:tetratricopeptide (TPR) repeat protein
LNSGEVVVRAIGSDLHMDYTAVGQTTHLAARMEQLAMPGSILITADVLRLAEGYVHVHALGLVPIKGLQDPVEVYELRGAGPVRTRLQATAVRGLTRFVGRDTEVAALHQLLARAGAGHGQVVALVGEAGVGKSRLVYEFIHSHRTQGWRVLESASVSYGKATPYFPVIELLKRYVHVEAADAPQAIRAKVTGQLLTLDDSLQETIPPLLALLDALPAAREPRDNGAGLRPPQGPPEHARGTQGTRAAASVWREMWSLAETLGDPHRLAVAVEIMGNAWSQMGDNVQALEFAQRALALAETVGAVDLLVSTRMNLGLLCRVMGDYRHGVTVLTQTVELLRGDLARERFGRPLYPAVTARQYLTTCLTALGEFRQAISTAEEGLRIAEAFQQPGSLLVAHVSRCEPLLHQGEFHDAVPRLERAMALYTPDLIAWYPMAAGALGFAYAMTGRLAEALPLLERAGERARRVDRRRETQWLAYLSEAYLRVGRQGDAHAVAERLLALGRERGERGTEARVLHLYGEITTQWKPPHAEEAEAYYRQALALAEALGMRPLQAHCYRGLGTLYAKTGRREQARAELSTAIDLYRAMAMTFWLPEAEAAMAQVEGR